MKAPHSYKQTLTTILRRAWKIIHFAYTKLWYISIPLSLILFACLTLYQSVLWGAWGPLPKQKELKQIKVPVASEIYSADELLMGKFYIQDRTQVSYQELHPDLVSALIATEDSRYYQHHGVDMYSLVRVVIRSILLGDEASGGGSTLSQQLAKNLFPRKSYEFLSLPVNKLREMITARRLERLYSKQEILAQYLNTVPFGENAYGISAACRRFFSSSPQKIKTEEAALLIGMLKAPTSYNPLKHPNEALTRRNIVLERMKGLDFLSKRRADSLSNTPLNINYQRASFHDGIAPYFREHLRQQLTIWANAHRRPDGSEINIYTDGLKVYTTLDSRLQEYAEEAVQEHMVQVQHLFNKKFKPLRVEHAAVKTAKKRSQTYKVLKAQSWEEQQIDSVLNISRTMDVFHWDGIKAIELSTIDSIRHYQGLLRAGFIVMEPKTGKIRAWVGGPDHRFFQYDHITSRRQTGSIFKPIVFAAALEAEIPPCEYIPNDKIQYAGFEEWNPQNSDQVYGGEYSMQGALAFSVNIAAINLFMKVGPKNVISLAKKLGINSELPEVPSLALGTADLSLKEMATAFSSLVNGGYYHSPLIISKVIDKDGYVLYDASIANPKGKQVISTETAQTMVQMLKGVVKMGTARGLSARYKLTAEMVGKTGTSQDQADGWFVGSTPRLLGAAWVGGDDRTIHFPSLRDGQGARTAMPIWGKFMQKVYADPSFEDIKADKFPKTPQKIFRELSCDPYTFMVSQSEFKKWWDAQNPESPDLVE